MSLIVGTETPETLSGAEDNDTIQGFGDDDRLLGGEGNDLIEGGEDDDWIKGNGGNDRLWGDAGDDLIEGDEGRDRLWGGSGAVDTFVFTGLAFTDLTISQTVQGTMVDVAGAGSIFLEGVFSGDLQESQFLFAEDPLLMT